MTSRFYTTEQVGDTRSLTPEGYLLCANVPVARTGMMIYGPDEVPVSAGPDGLIRISREEDQVFSDEFLASLNGKSVVDDHPDVDVDPTNWKQLTVGVGMNPRRGTGFQSDLVIMDLLITDQNAIKQVQEGKVEISLGYEADYEEIQPGYGRQVGLIGNHIALVEKGRCGPRCAIGDQLTIKEGEAEMKTRDKARSKPASRTRISDALAKMFAAFKAKDEEGMEEALEEVRQAEDAMLEETKDESGVHIHLQGGGEIAAPVQTDEDPEANPAAPAAGKFSDDDIESFMQQNAQEHEEMRNRIAALEAKLNGGTGDESDPEEEQMADELAEEAPEGTKDSARKAKDSALLRDSFQETIALAEILAPGLRVPTYDAKLSPKKTLDSICRHRRTALDLAYATAEGRSIIDDVNGKPMDLPNMSCGAVRTLFRAAAAAKRVANNSGTKDRAGSGHQPTKGVASIADLNKRLAEHYK